MVCSAGPLRSSASETRAQLVLGLLWRTTSRLMMPLIPFAAVSRPVCTARTSSRVTPAPVKGCTAGSAPLRIVYSPAGSDPWSDEQWSLQSEADVRGTPAFVLRAERAADGSDVGLAAVCEAAGGTVSVASLADCAGDAVLDEAALLHTARGLS